MSELILPRRGFLFGLVGAFAALAIIKATSLMPISAPRKLIVPFSQKDLARATYERDGQIRIGGNVYSPEYIAKVLAKPVDAVKFAEVRPPSHSFVGFSDLGIENDKIVLVPRRYYNLENSLSPV